ncbi:50S ribosomal protein L15 [Candidatus Haliotispira prima]|uniref:Large ribosomal subunit protein uL15 n=1 Tax=Candidatus Haliotispira prima TaxID=3034016 RepID=A0ABY8MG07_9SPIO|nr:50S ribosomal protein L15 [Candidatus Haliotispira prima]
MSVYELKPAAGSKRKRKIVGRGTGSGLGKTSGKGHKGQKARSGGGVRMGFEGGQIPLYRRLAVRGFSNHPFKKTWVVINLDRIDALFSDSETVNRETLQAKGLIKKSETNVKILNRGEFNRKGLTVEVPSISKAACARIEDLGGKVRLSTGVPVSTEA